MNYAYLIYQIKDMKTDYAFMGWNFAKDRINLMDYDGVYYGRSIDGENPIAVLENCLSGSTSIIQMTSKDIQCLSVTS